MFYHFSFYILMAVSVSHIMFNVNLHVIPLFYLTIIRKIAIVNSFG